MARLIKIPTKKDNRGELSIVEDLLPFTINRVFYIYNVTAKRGGHRHIENHMGLIALGGKVDVLVQTPLTDLKFELTSPDELLLLDPEDWHEMDNFSNNSTLLVLCSQKWSAEDYIYEPYRNLNDRV